MILKAFAIRDLKADVFNPPFFFPAVGQAIRFFGDLASDPQSMVSKHPEDYQLFRVGEFDDQSGILASLEHPQMLGGASEMLRLNGQVIGLTEKKGA